MSQAETIVIKEIKVLIGQVHITRPPHLLQSVLGSCIGLAIYDQEIHLAGMAHVLLPDSGDKPRGGLPGKYGDHAVACLIEGLVAHGAVRSRLRAKIAGGARMFDHQLNYQRDIGACNAESVMTRLEAAGIRLMGKEIGGGLGRRASFDPKTLRMIVEDFARNETIL